MIKVLKEGKGTNCLRYAVKDVSGKQAQLEHCNETEEKDHE